jgi:hypothetical protein
MEPSSLMSSGQSGGHPSLLGHVVCGPDHTPPTATQSDSLNSKQNVSEQQAPIGCGQDTESHDVAFP